MRAGERVGPYVVVSELGRGGMGLVLRARHAATGAEVALKVLDASLVDAEAVTRFDREGKALARVAGDGIVPVHAAGLDGRQRWIALGLMGGGSLRDRMKASGAWPWERAVELVRGLAATLGRCHAAGIVHRDLKPENILFDDAGRAHVADFGLVRDLAAQALTLSGTVMGTPAYMAPEQLEGLRADARADVWALGVLLHELVAGDRPWVGKQTVQLLGQITASPRARLTGRGAPEDLDGVLDGALTLDAGLRYPDAAALAAELDRVLTREAPAVVLERRARLRQRRQLGALSIAALMAVGAAGVAVWRELARRRAEVALTERLQADAARIDSWRGALRTARCDGVPPAPADLAGLQAALELAEDGLLAPALGDLGEVKTRAAQVAPARGRLELAVARGATAEARDLGAALATLKAPREEDALLRLLAELGAAEPDHDALERDLALVQASLRKAQGALAADLRLAAARAHLGLGRPTAAVGLLTPAFATAGLATRGELLLGARCAGELGGLEELVRASLDRVPPPDPLSLEVGAAALDGLLVLVSRAAAAGAERDVEAHIQTAWTFELEHRERWRTAAAGPKRRPRTERTLLLPRHAAALRAALARLEETDRVPTARVAARAFELLAVCDPAAPPPTRTWQRLHTAYTQDASTSRRPGGLVPETAKDACEDMRDMLRIGLPIQASAIHPSGRDGLRSHVDALCAADDRDWTIEALRCTLHLHGLRNYQDPIKERSRAPYRAPLLDLARSRLLSPGARAAVALSAADFGLIVAGDISTADAERVWLSPAVEPERRAQVEEGRRLLEAHRAASATPDLVDELLAMAALLLGEPAEADRLAQRALALTRLRSAGQPIEGRPGAPGSIVQFLPITMRRVRARALRELGRVTDAEAVEAEDDTLRPR